MIQNNYEQISIVDAIKSDLIHFKIDSDIKQLTIEMPLNNNDRASIHEACKKMGLHSKSGESLENGLKKITVFKEQLDVIFEREYNDTEKELSKYLDIPESVSSKINAKAIQMWSQYYKIPLATPNPKYLIYYIELYDKHYNIKKSLQLLINALTKYGSIEILKSHREQVFNKICSKLISIKEFERSDIKFQSNLLPPKVNIYSGIIPSYVPSYIAYISLDVKQANFNSYKYADVLMGNDTYQKLLDWCMKEHGETIDPFLSESKYFRQLIFGKVGGKKCASIQKHFMSVFYALLMKNCPGIAERISKLGTEEMIVKTTSDTMDSDMHYIYQCMNLLPEKMQHIWKCIPFYLKSIGTKVNFAYEKRTIVDIQNSKYDNDESIKNLSLEIKGIEKDFHSQAYKYVIGLDPTIEDLKAIKDNRHYFTYDEYQKFV